MNSFSNIFPIGYPNIPTEEDLDFEVQDLLRHSDSPFDIIHYINDIECPYYRKAFAILVPPKWHNMERDGKNPAVFEDMDGYYITTWLNIDSDIGRIIKKANAEQVELENQTTPQETLNTKHSYTSSASDRSSKGEIRTLNSQTMPLIIKGDPQVINHYEGAHYENCTFINGTPTTNNQHIEDVVPVNEDQPTEPTTLPDTSALIFKPNEQNRDAIETLIKEALATSNKKSVICRKLYQQREIFNLHTQDDTTKASIINAWVKKLGIERNFKALFNRKDFGNYYCKS